MLFVAEDVPYPVVTGYRVRLATALRALTRLGAVDAWISALGTDDSEGLGAAPVPLRRHRVVATRYRTLPRRMAAWARSGLPRSLLEFDGRAAGADLTAWADAPYDLVWCVHLRTYTFIAGVVDAPTVLDLDNLGDSWLRHRLAADAFGLRSRPRAALARIADRIDERRYARMHSRAVAEVDAVAVCSELDRVRLGTTKAVIVPNAYVPPDPKALLLDAETEAPIILIVGLFDYPPNEDAARSFAREVFPLVRDQIPGAQLRLVGRHYGAIDDLMELPGVIVTGPVPDVATELRRAHVVAAPIRFGAGTRVKIIEAFAYRVPVVSTTVGCEGLAVEPGKHLLVADNATEMGEACVRVISDGRLRQRLTDAASAVFDANYAAPIVQEKIRAIASGVLDRAHLAG